MRHIASTALVLMLLAAIAPVASAQIPTEAPATVKVRLAPLDGPVGPDGANVQMEVQYCYHALGSFAFRATQVTLKIQEWPSWASVAVTPATLYFEIQNGPASGSTVCAAPQSATVQVLPHDNVTDPQPGKLRVSASARPNAPIAGASSEDAVLLKASEAACHHEEVAAHTASEDASGSDGTLTAQTASATPLAAPVSALVVALGLAGASAGAVVGFRRRRG